jgi:hypothetical protein
MRMSCSITSHHVVGGGPVLLLVIETPAYALAVIAIGIPPSSKTVAYPLDTEPLFGFTEGAHIGSDGAKELLIDSTLREATGTGSLANKTSALGLKYTALQNSRVSAVGSPRLLRHYREPRNRGPSPRCRTVVVLRSELLTRRSRRRAVGVDRKRRSASGICR